MLLVEVLGHAQKSLTRWLKPTAGSLYSGEQRACSLRTQSKENERVAREFLKFVKPGWSQQQALHLLTRYLKQTCKTPLAKIKVSFGQATSYQSDREWKSRHPRYRKLVEGEILSMGWENQGDGDPYPVSFYFSVGQKDRLMQISKFLEELRTQLLLWVEASGCFNHAWKKVSEYAYKREIEVVSGDIKKDGQIKTSFLNQAQPLVPGLYFVSIEFKQGNQPFSLAEFMNVSSQSVDWINSRSGALV